MASAYTPDATTLEGQILESFQKLQELELAYNAANPEEEPLNNAQIAIDAETGNVTLTIALPVSIAVAEGGFEVTALPYVN